MILGVCYYPKHWPRTRWATDARLMREAGLDIVRRLGYFVTESSEHFSEYVPWFIKRGRPDLIDRFNISPDEYIRRSVISLSFADHRSPITDYRSPITGN